jgi:iron complex transport system substrate-binding protein
LKPSGPVPYAGEVRLVSLLPSATEIVYALGLGDDLAGVTFECDEPPAARTDKAIVVGGRDTSGMSPGDIDRYVRTQLAAGQDLYTLHARALAGLAPDLILTQDLCRVCALPSGHVNDALTYLGCQADVLTLDPHSLDDVLDSILIVGQRAGVADRAERLVGGLRARLARVAASVAGAGAAGAAVAGAGAAGASVAGASVAGASVAGMSGAGMSVAGMSVAGMSVAGMSAAGASGAGASGGGPGRPRVAVVEWVDPPFSAGHWVPDLVTAAGGEAVAARPGARSVQMSWADIAAAGPDLVVVAPCGFHLAGAVEQARLVAGALAAEGLADVPVWAIDADGIVVRPGPRLVNGVEALAAILHPQAVPAAPPGAVRRVR